MEASIKSCIISGFTPKFVNGTPVEYAHNYEKGQNRLKRSLVHHGFSYDLHLWQDWPQNTPIDTSIGYNIKAACFIAARDMGYTNILWLDSSVWAIKNPNEIFDIINHEGYYMWRSGFNCAQTCNDQSLNYFGITRDMAETINDCSSSMLGLNLGNPKGEHFLKKWLLTCRAGMWGTSRQHDNGSEDSRYLFDRQDQSCASVIAGLQDMKLYDPGQYSDIGNDSGKYNDSVIFVMRGV